MYTRTLSYAPSYATQRHRKHDLCGTNLQALSAPKRDMEKDGVYPVRTMRCFVYAKNTIRTTGSDDGGMNMSDKNENGNNKETTPAGQDDTRKD